MRVPLTDRERAVVRRAAARNLRYRRWQRRTRGRKGRRETVLGFQGETAEDVLDAFVSFTERPRYWHSLADAACALADRVAGKERKRTVPPRRRVA